MNEFKIILLQHEEAECLLCGEHCGIALQVSRDSYCSNCIYDAIKSVRYSKIGACAECGCDSGYCGIDCKTKQGNRKKSLFLKRLKGNSRINELGRL